MKTQEPRPSGMPRRRALGLVLATVLVAAAAAGVALWPRSSSGDAAPRVTAPHGTLPPGGGSPPASAGPGRASRRSGGAKGAFATPTLAPSSSVEIRPADGPAIMRPRAVTARYEGQFDGGNKGTYGFTLTYDQPRASGPDITQTVTADKDAEPYDTAREHVYRWTAQSVLIATEGWPEANHRCTWSPPVIKMPRQIKVGATWRSKGQRKCTVDVGIPVTKFRAESGIILRIGRARVPGIGEAAVMVIRREIDESESMSPDSKTNAKSSRKIIEQDTVSLDGAFVVERMQKATEQSNGETNYVYTTYRVKDVRLA